MSLTCSLRQVMAGFRNMAEIGRNRIRLARSRTIFYRPRKKACRNRTKIGRTRTKFGQSREIGRSCPKNGRTHPNSADSVEIRTQTSQSRPRVVDFAELRRVRGHYWPMNQNIDRSKFASPVPRLKHPLEQPSVGAPSVHEIGAQSHERFFARGNPSTEI